MILTLLFIYFFFCCLKWLVSVQKLQMLRQRPTHPCINFSVVVAAVWLVSVFTCCHYSCRTTHTHAPRSTKLFYSEHKVIIRPAENGLAGRRIQFWAQGRLKAPQKRDGPLTGTARSLLATGNHQHNSSHFTGAQHAWLIRWAWLIAFRHISPARGPVRLLAAVPSADLFQSNCFLFTANVNVTMTALIRQQDYVCVFFTPDWLFKLILFSNLHSSILDPPPSTHPQTQTPPPPPPPPPPEHTQRERSVFNKRPTPELFQRQHWGNVWDTGWGAYMHIWVWVCVF